MAAKTTLNAKNLEALGAQRLAELLIEISMGSAAHKRRLRMELAGNQGSAEVAREVRKRLASIARARSFIEWHKVKTVNADLETQRSTIVTVVAADDPKEAFDLIWQFLAVADSIFERSNSGDSVFIETFHQACADAGVIASAAGIGIDVLADKIFTALQDNDHGQYDPLIAEMLPALGDDGLEHLKSRLVQWSNEAEEKPDDADREVFGNGPIYRDEIDANHRQMTARIALQEIADAQNDVDAFIAQLPEQTLRAPMIAAEIADRLLLAGRAEDALTILDGADHRGRFELPFEWQRARVEALAALGRGEEAQAYQWQCFEQSLNGEHLRAFLRRLPDFDDIEAEEKAFAFVHGFPDVHPALAFFLTWPALAEAAKLISNRHAELDGNLYELMTPAAEILQEKHPLAATMLLRAMIGFALDYGRSSRYKHAARHLAECASLAPHIDDFGSARPHDAYVIELKRKHGNKHGFWSLLR
ncbi:hypothetical protein RJJ65_28145 [Rhizobium hidalgonense]|uniref:Uncharacterized protein n=1 Tax=Rhizobium hidalgonense TaxID=1538159 RepID=A0A2A6K796_9HYPH|nr:DUF6880 family protein [Rhizobium hidalgonense]MDR9776453.1 hypothetical protein [Rhizobium hidalgonense]MDR9814359.1 hypothetical protein [Rhizobium hidalgonense]MDR9822990.1 hypothetical protein [Rhizobium hidalgonense]PDT20428.1 hypothetical protein CO674_27870 [Rhizobium hidalgonense]PON06671.1 hypothetical protein ATY29_15460 [Rhizobium hidalgonense]